MTTSPDVRPERARTGLRAKQACKECNLRRIRCNVMDMQPCWNCQSSKSTCEVLPSRRGRYPRKARKPLTNAATDAPSLTCAAHDPPSPKSSSSIASPAIHVPTTAQRGTSSEDRLFFGESSFLTCVTGPDADPEVDTPDARKSQLSYCISDETPVQDGRTIVTANGLHRIYKFKYLQDEGAFTFPSPPDYLPTLQAYFQWFHPCFPILDKVEIARRFSTGTLSPSLLQAMLFVGATYCEENAIHRLGFQDRREAKSQLYNRAKILFEADWEKDKVTTLQTVFLLSFWRAGMSDIKDVRYWLGIAVTLAQTSGFHRSTRFTTVESRLARLRRRIWWSIYVRDRQSCTSLGLPSGIRDEDCDVECLGPADFEVDTDEDLACPFARTQPEHTVYAIKMVEIAKLLGKVINGQFTPGHKYSDHEDRGELMAAIQQWAQDLPEEMTGCGLGNRSGGIWAYLLHLGYNHLQILVHRNSFLRYGSDDRNGDERLALQAACRITRIVEDMMSHNMIQFGQMHSITSLFASLCIHTIDIRRSTGVMKKLAEHRAQICLLGLKEIQKYWKINNTVLELFFRYLDESIVQRLQNGEAERAEESATGTAHQNAEQASWNARATHPAAGTFSEPPGDHTALESSNMAVNQEQIFNMQQLSWGMEDMGDDFEYYLNPDNYVNAEQGAQDFDMLERYL